MSSSTSVRSGIPQSESRNRSDRVAFIGFVIDHDTEHAVRRGLELLLGDNLDVRRGNIRSAIAALARISSPKVILVDVSGEADPTLALSELSDVVEPDVRVLVVGEHEDVRFYRQITRNLGVIEYLYKPLTTELVARQFSTVFDPTAISRTVVGGRLVTVTGAGGGVGATTIAVNLAWYLANHSRRFTLAVDADLRFGAMATMLGVHCAAGFRTILEAPHRVDDLFISRAVMPVGNRLSLLSGEEPINETPAFSEEALELMLRYVSRRYNFIVADASPAIGSLGSDILQRAHQRVLIFEPTVVSLRNVHRFLSLPDGVNQVQRPLLVLNRYKQPGGLSLPEVEVSLGGLPYLVLPYLPKVLCDAANLGEVAVEKNDAFRKGIARLAHEVGAISTFAAERRSRIKGILGKLKMRTQ